jgi:Glycosyltransferase 61
MCWTLVEIRFPTRASLACSLAIIGIVLVQSLYVLNNIALVIPYHQQSTTVTVVKADGAKHHNDTKLHLEDSKRNASDPQRNASDPHRNASDSRRNSSSPVLRRLESTYIGEINEPVRGLYHDHSKENHGVLIKLDLTEFNARENGSGMNNSDKKITSKLHSDRKDGCERTNSSGFSSVDNHQYRSFRYMFHSVPILEVVESQTENEESTSYPYFTHVEKDVDDDVNEEDDHDTYTFPMEKFAVCEFVDELFAYHFPHTMQQLYRCWSWWRVQRHDTTPVLIFPHTTLPNNQFLLGFVTALKRNIGLRMLKPDEIGQLGLTYSNNDNGTLMIDSKSTVVSYVRPRYPPNLVDPRNLFGMNDPTCTYFSFHSIEDARDLRATFLGYSANTLMSKNINSSFEGNAADHIPDIDAVSTNTPIPPITDATAGKQIVPKITIINRRNNRELLVAEDIVTLLQRANKDFEVQIVYIDSNTTFEEQIRFFATTDILISPHGAQLIGIPFMPDCGIVFEIFPVGYYLPYYFGSLASAAGLMHSFTISTNSDDWRSECMVNMKDRKSRQSVRNKPICIDPVSVAGSVLSLVDSWKQCQRIHE